VANEDDASSIAGIQVRGWRAAYRHVFPAAELDRMPVDAGRWRPRLASPPAGWTTFVCERDGRVVGFASVGPSRDEPGAGELYAIYVEPEEWSTGSGAALIRRAEATLRREYPEATLWVLEDNPRARAFYERGGWQPDGATKAEVRWGVRAREVRYRKSWASGAGGA
jgi:GNAT superfamily N-acetyltransferase